ncbi:tyrosine-type recombinase/integrase [Leptospira harrisiae]|uniref:tyrosine-type recombinase/integrase n=1 Tax=Leptospira harrisiae TaxID=2023189 RepID=UPI000C2A5ADE|nr:tyrosine-type recombinase/integrase [Leptospira harrisiae]PKA09327.1 hypothetical protein CH366_06355 [Leptospira harrisiae]
MEKFKLSNILNLPVSKRELNRFLSFYKSLNGKQITSEAIIRYLLSRRQAGITSKTLKADKSAILHCLKILSLGSEKSQLELTKIKSIVHESVKLHCPPTRIRETDLISESEMKLFMKQAPLRLRLIAYFLWTTGLRPHELLNLKWKDGIQKGEFVEFTLKGKGERIRHILAPSELVAKLFPTFQSKDYLFANLKGEQLTQNALNKMFSRYGVRILGRRVFPYLFRHSFATSQIKAGIDIGAISEFMGNSPELLVRVYLHSSMKADSIMHQYQRIA